MVDSNNDGSEEVPLNGSASSDPDGSIVSYEWREGTTVIGMVASPSVWLNVGTHTLTLQVTDNAGESSTDAVLVTVNPPPNAPPSANAGADQTVTDSDGDGTQAVTLNGGASSDSDGTIVSYVWREGASTMATGVSPTVSLSVGTHTLTLQVTDDDGATATDSMTVTVKPFVPPPPRLRCTSATSTARRAGTRAVGRRR